MEQLNQVTAILGVIPTVILAVLTFIGAASSIVGTLNGLVSQLRPYAAATKPKWDDRFLEDAGVQLDGAAKILATIAALLSPFAIRKPRV